MKPSPLPEKVPLTNLYVHNQHVYRIVSMQMCRIGAFGLKDGECYPRSPLSSKVRSGVLKFCYAFIITLITVTTASQQVADRDVTAALAERP